jgi:hypothetical protein
VTDVYVVGLATDYCVKFTALDAQDLGFKTFVIEEACRGVELQEGDVRRALMTCARPVSQFYRATTSKKTNMLSTQSLALLTDLVSVDDGVRLLEGRRRRH